MKTIEMEIALAVFFKYKSSIIVPSVRWGMNIHECDLLVMTKKGFLYEIEIKRTKQDLKADLKKRHQHNDKRIKYFYFAIPEKLLKSCEEYIPKRAGIIILKRHPERNWYGKIYPSFLACTIFRKPKLLGKYKCNENERMKLMRLGYLRIWSLKKKIIKIKNLYEK